MLKIIKAIFGICDHQWETIKTDLIRETFFASGKSYIVGETYHLRCKKCGNVKSKRISID